MHPATHIPNPVTPQRGVGGSPQFRRPEFPEFQRAGQGEKGGGSAGFRGETSDFFRPDQVIFRMKLMDPQGEDILNTTPDEERARALHAEFPVDTCTASCIQVEDEEGTPDWKALRDNGIVEYYELYKRGVVSREVRTPLANLKLREDLEQTLRAKGFIDVEELEETAEAGLSDIFGAKLGERIYEHTISFLTRERSEASRNSLRGDLSQKEQELAAREREFKSREAQHMEEKSNLMGRISRLEENQRQAGESTVQALAQAGAAITSDPVGGRASGSPDPEPQPVRGKGRKGN